MNRRDASKALALAALLPGAAWGQGKRSLDLQLLGFALGIHVRPLLRAPRPGNRERPGGANRT